MAGLKRGSRVLQIGGDGDLAAALAGVTGLSGQACAVVQEDAQTRAVERAAARAGVLVDVKTARLASLPYDAAAFDVVVIKNVLGHLRQNERVFCVQEAARVLRPGGRCLVMEPAPRGGLGALLSRRETDPLYAGGARAALAAEGFAGVRILAEQDGQRFTEGIRP